VTEAAAPSLEVVDRGEATAAIAVLAPLFEGAPTFLARLLAERPFGSWDALFEQARAIAHAMPERDQVELVNAHPRLGAATGSVSALSFREQGYDRAPSGATESQAGAASDELARLNAAYETAFGFRYCVFVAGRPLPTLLPELRTALSAERGAELRRALDAVVDIAIARQRALAGAG
jgi:2-oxo-4-hydroxy-4-carboxy--5-ureidoimidazoline (OHCU) decarboxylase